MVAASGGGLADALASPAQDYMLYCMGCHGAEAQGVPGKVPPLALTLRPLMGSPAGRDYLLRVPGAANSVLSDGQLAGVLNWLAATFGAHSDSKSPAPFTAQEVTRSRHSPLPSVLAARQAVIKSIAAAGGAPPVSY